MKRALQIAISLMSLFVINLHAGSLQAQASQGPTPAIANYPDSPDGLRDFLSNLLASIKDGDTQKVGLLWKSTIIPDHQEWFTAEFGTANGVILEKAYSQQLAISASNPTRIVNAVAGLKNAKIVVMPLAQAAVNRPNSPARSLWLSLKLPVSAYRAEAISEGGVASYTLGYFFYVRGGFRLLSEDIFDGLSAASRPQRLPYISAAEAQLLLLQSSQPAVPPLARRPGISNTVVLDVIIDVLGQVKSASIQSGDLTLGNAARAAVLGWRYRPYIQNGRPTDVETTVTITFPF